MIFGKGKAQFYIDSTTVPTEVIELNYINSRSNSTPENTIYRERQNPLTLEDFDEFLGVKINETLTVSTNISWFGDFDDFEARQSTGNESDVSKVFRIENYYKLRHAIYYKRHSDVDVFYQVRVRVRNYQGLIQDDQVDITLLGKVLETDYNVLEYTITEPTAQPTSLVFSNLNDTSLTLSWTHPSPRPYGYVILFKTGGYPADNPSDGTYYAVGATIGASTVGYIGAANTCTITGLTANTTYYFEVFAFNGNGTSVNYLTTSPLQGNKSTIATKPTAQATALVYSNVTGTAMDVAFTGASGSPDGYIVLMKEGSAPTGTPVNGTGYSVGNTIGDGTVVKFGSGTTFSVSSLTANREYFFSVISFNGTTNTYNYLTTSPLSGSKFTLTTEPTAQASGLTLEDTGVARRVEINFTEASPAADGYILVRRLTSASNVTPVDGTVYSDGATLGTDVYVVHMGAYSDFSGGYTDMSGLIGIDNYTYYVYAYTGSGVGSGSPNYCLTSPPSAAISFLQPSSQPTNLVLTQTSTSPNIVTVTFDEVAGVQFYLVVRRLTASGAPNNPVDGTEYADDATYGSGNTKVVHAGHYSDFAGSGWEDDQASLTDADWTWAVYAYNYGDVPNYLTTSPLTDNLVVT